jgi:hypothetical protein
MTNNRTFLQQIRPEFGVGQGGPERFPQGCPGTQLFARTGFLHDRKETAQENLSHPIQTASDVSRATVNLTVDHECHSKRSIFCR